MPEDEDDIAIIRPAAPPDMPAETPAAAPPVAVAPEPATAPPDAEPASEPEAEVAPAPAASPSAPPPVAQPQAASVESDLDGLPGAGPGLIWMLHRAGVPDLATLAQADQQELAQKLGVIGEILDLGYWIDHARSEAANA